MTSSDIANRKVLTFAQAEGAASLPAQHQRTEVSPKLRVRLWDVLHREMTTDIRAGLTNKNRRLSNRWSRILRDEHVKIRGKYSHEFSDDLTTQMNRVFRIFDNGDYIEIFDFLQFLLRHENLYNDFANKIAEVLKEERAAYRIFEHDTFIPVGSDEEADAISLALSTTAGQHHQGPYAHLKAASEALGSGRFADSVRESINAVEATARTIEPSSELSKSLFILENTIKLHPAMRKGFAAIYGYTSDEKGIRHPLLDSGDANVDEADAMFMIGACASFVTYLISKRRKAGMADE